MTSSQFSMCSFNVGAGLDDYRRFKAYCDNEKLVAVNAYGKLPPQAHGANLGPQYGKALRETATYLANKAQVYFLQEIGKLSRPLTKTLKNNNFAIHHVSQNIDTVIALDKNRFSSIVNHSISIPLDAGITKDAAIVTAVDRMTKERVLFASIHAPGCDLTKKVTSADAKRGDTYCSQVAKEIEKIARREHATVQVVAGDLNVDPAKWSRRFEIFKGFKTHAPSHITNVNPLHDDPHRERTLDYFLLSTSNKNNLIQPINHHRAVTLENHCSDHFPIFANVVLKPVDAKNAPKSSGGKSKSYHKSSSSKKPKASTKSKHVSSSRKGGSSSRVKRSSKPTLIVIQPQKSIFARIWQIFKACLCCCFMTKRTT